MHFSFAWVFGRMLALSAIAVIPLAAACGGDESGGAGTITGGTSAVGTSTGGTSTVGTGATGGSSSGSADTSGTGGTAGTPPAEVFDPSIELPSYDCRNDTATRACVSIRGTFAGEPLDRYCGRDTSPGLLLRSPDAWPVACQEGATPDEGWFYQISVPIQAPGSFHHEVVEDDAFIGANVVVMENARGSDFESGNFVSGAVAGTVTRDPATEDDVIVGTFRGTFGAPGVLCNALFADECEAAQVHGTFKVVHFLKVSN